MRTALLSTTTVCLALLSTSWLCLAQDTEPTPEAKSEPLRLTIEGPVDAELAPVAGKLAEHFYQCYPKLLERFENPDKAAPRQIRIVFDPKLNIPAHCSGGTVTVGIDWLKKHPGDIGMLCHELTHAVQAYPRGAPGWLTEGIADYARSLYGPEKQPEWELPKKLGPRQSYKDSYRVAARFLVWLDEKHPGTIDKLHRQMQNRKFEIENFSEFTGKDVETLWRECVQELDR
jgi:hypothetical protein